MDRYKLESLASTVKPPICPDCGSTMIVTGARNSRIYGKFDQQGNRLYLLVYSCPKQKWYHIGSYHLSQLRLVKEKL